MKVKTIRIDLAKEVFGVHGVDPRRKALVHRRVTRKHLLGLLARLEPCLVGMEACGSAHHWARAFTRFATRRLATAAPSLSSFFRWLLGRVG
jgi:transposase